MSGALALIGGASFGSFIGLNNSLIFVAGLAFGLIAFVINFGAFSGNFNHALIYVSGDYIVNEKLTISGTVYKEFSFNNSPDKYPALRDIEGKGMIMGINYRPAENFHINASFEYYRGNNPFRTNPFYHPGYSGPGIW